MNYYKLIDGQNLIGVVTDDAFRKYQAKHSAMIFSNTEQAQCVEFKDKYYSDTWMRRSKADKITFLYIKIIRISEEEYNALVEAFETKEVIEVNNTEEVVVDESLPKDENDTLTVEFVKEQKIAQLSNECKNIITNGVDVILSDGKSHHFSMSIEDQMKIQALVLKAQAGEKVLFWHEDGQPCKFFPAEDVMLIYGALEKLQTYHTTYFNSLKMYVMSLDNVNDISGVNYGMDVPSEFQSEVYAYLMNALNSSEG